jgi:hypothetical protein
VGVDEVEGGAFVAEVGQAAGARLLVGFDAGVDPFLLAELFETGAQGFEPLYVDDAGQDGVALVVEVFSILVCQYVFTGA